MGMVTLLLYMVLLEPIENFLLFLGDLDPGRVTGTPG